MAISYEPMWNTMREKGISQNQMIRQGIDKKTLYAIRHGQNINTSTLERICRILQCEASEVITFTQD